MFLCYPVVGEMWHSVYAGSRNELNERAIHTLTAQYEVLPFGAEAAREYGRLRHLLRQAGRETPQVDLQIMAISVVHHLTVLTADAHFREVPGVSVENWLA